MQSIPPGTTLHVTARHSYLCNLKAVDAASLTCAASGDRKELTLTRSEIRKITLTRCGRSTALMAGVGAGIGVAAVAAASKAIGFGGGAKAGVFAGGAGLGAVIGAPIGYFSDLLRGPAIYTAP
jgi:hypothetical protein